MGRFNFGSFWGLVQKSLDNINHEVNEQYSKVLFKFLEDKLGVPGDRGYMCVPKTHHTIIHFSGSQFFLIVNDPAR